MDRGAWQATVHGVTKSQTRGLFIIKANVAFLTVIPEKYYYP